MNPYVKKRYQEHGEHVSVQKIVTLAFCFLILSFVNIALAQNEFGALQGRVTDAEGLPIPGATVTASSPSLIGGASMADTDRDGHYRFSALTPGTYELKAELPGFQFIIRKGVRLLLGNTVTIGFILQPETIQESITVLEAPPLIDSATTATSNNVPPELVQNLPKPQRLSPTERSSGILSLLSLTPAVGSDLVAYGGAGAPANRIWIDGVDVSSPQAGLLFADYNYNWIEEVQIAAIGAPAEYGGFTGAVGNFITRSGSDYFHGLFETFFQNEKLVSSNTPESESELPFKSYDITAQLGGPILHDKVWFFGGLHYPYTQSRPFGYEGVTTREYPKVLGKLTYKPNQNNTIQGFAHYNHHYLDGLDASARTLPEATSTDECHESSWNSTWVSILNSSTTFEGRFGGFWANCEILPRNGDIPGYVDLDTGVASVNAHSHSAEQRFRPQVNASVSHLAQNFMGTHDFKFGVQWQRANSSFHYGYNGGFAYYTYADDHGYPVTVRYGRISGVDASFENRIHQASLYAQDSWNLNDDFTLSLGIRWDHNRGLTDRGTVFATDPVAPRIGFVWKVRENRVTVLKAHYGKYFETLLAAQFGHLTDQVLGLVGEQFNPTTGVWETFERSQEKYLSVSDIKPPFVRQFTLGIDQELPGGIALGAHYIYREWGNILQDIDTSTRYEPVPYVNPITGETITVFQVVDTFADKIFLLTNPSDLFREYNGIEVIANRRFSNNLAISGSFVYSRITGNIPNTPDNVNPFTPFLDDPNNSINFTGNLVNDPTLVWKLAGTYALPWGLNTGWFFRHESGDSWTPLIRVTGLNQGVFVVFGLPRGTNRLPSTNILDLRVEKMFAISSGEFRITADIFNIFNSATVTGVNVVFGTPEYQRPLSITEPRRVHLGLRYTF